ncbi:hypothetical protein [Streptomyces sp. LMG1-1-1.1]
MTFPQAPALPEELDKPMLRMRLPYMRLASTRRAGDRPGRAAGPR